MKRIQITQTGVLRTKYGSFEIDDTNIVNAVNKAVGEEECDDGVCAAVTITIDVLTEPLNVAELATE